MAFQEQKMENETQQHDLIKFIRSKLSTLKPRNNRIFPSKIFHNAKGIGIIHIGYDELNNATENVGNGIIFTHWRNNEKKACGPIFVNIRIGNDYNKEMLNKKLSTIKDNTYVIILKEEPQMYDLCEEKKHFIKLGIDYNIEGIVKDDYDGILIFEINNETNELQPIEDVSYLRDLHITINKNEMYKYYNTNKINVKDVYEGTIQIPSNRDYIECERLIYEKFMIHFTEKDIVRGTLGQGIRHQYDRNNMHELWNKILFESPMERIVSGFLNDDIWHPFYNRYNRYGNNQHREMNKHRDQHEDIIPNCHVVEKNNEYEIDCDLPGINKNDININFNGENGMLEIEAKRENEKKYDQHDMHYQEISYGNYCRRLHLPKSLHVENKDVKAKYNNGVLTINVPKSQVLNQQYRVNIE